MKLYLPILLAMTLASALSILWISEQIDCLLNPGTDTCVGCVNDCMDSADEVGEPITEEEN